MIKKIFYKFSDMLEETCLHNKKWGLYISFNECEFSELVEAASFLAATPDVIQIWLNGWGIFLFDTRKEMEAHFLQCVGDDGPTKENPYDGPARVYALTCDNTGKLLTENT